MIKKKQTVSAKLISENSFFPFAVRRAMFSKLYDYDQNKFFDFCLFHGQVVLGYSHHSIRRALKNSLSRGFTNGYETHLTSKVKKMLQTLFHYPFVNFFHSKENLSAYLKLHHRSDEMLDKISSLRNPLSSSEKPLLLDASVSNAFPVLVLLSHENLAPFQDDPVSVLALESMKVVLEEYQKPFWEKTFDGLLKPFQRELENLGGGRFQLKSGIKAKEVSEKLFENCIFVHPEQEVFYLAQNTEPHQVKYLVKVLSKI